MDARFECFGVQIDLPVTLFGSLGLVGLSQQEAFSEGFQPEMRFFRSAMCSPSRMHWVLEVIV